VYSTIEYLDCIQPVAKLMHSVHLEKSARDFFSMDNPEDNLAERVERYSSWDGELDEIVHYTKKGVNGRDVLMSILLSDGPESTNNKDIIFGEYFNYFGIKVGVNSTSDYCVVLDYADQLGSDRIKTASRTLCKIFCSEYFDFNFYS
jgi:hypothetical protein